MGELFFLMKLAFVFQGEKRSGALTPACKTVFEEAKRLDVVDKGAGIVGEILFTAQVATQAKDYQRLLLQVDISFVLEVMCILFFLRMMIIPTLLDQFLWEHAIILSDSPLTTLGHCLAACEIF